MVQTRAQLRRAGQGQQPADAADFESQHAQTKAEQVAQGTPKQAAGMTDQHAAQAMSVPSVLAGLQTGMQVPRYARRAINGASYYTIVTLSASQHPFVRFCATALKKLSRGAPMYANIVCQAVTGSALVAHVALLLHLSTVMIS